MFWQYDKEPGDEKNEDEEFKFYSNVDGLCSPSAELTNKRRNDCNVIITLMVIVFLILKFCEIQYRKMDWSVVNQHLFPVCTQCHTALWTLYRH